MKKLIAKYLVEGGARWVALYDIFIKFFAEGVIAVKRGRGSYFYPLVKYVKLALHCVCGAEMGPSYAGDDAWFKLIVGLRK